MNDVPWPWPLAPLFLLAPLALAWLLFSLEHTHIVRGEVVSGRATALGAAPVAVRERVPIFRRFREEILPVLAALWLVLLAAFLLTGEPALWVILPWSTVTVMMLWPVGRMLGVPYLAYRSPIFILGVLSMAYIIFTGIAMRSDLPFMAKSVIFCGLVLDLTILGIAPSLPWAIGRPLGMFFRPDLIFGDGRVLCCGTIALVLGMRYMIGTPAPDGAPWPIPKWDWYAILFAISIGFVPLIPLRGILKLIQRLRRVIDDRWGGWGAIVAREAILVVGLLAIGYGFHNAFLGRQPFTSGFLNIPAFWQALAITLVGALFLIVVRGGYKRHIGEPFVRETIGQTWIKEGLYLVGATILFYGLMSLLHTDRMAFDAGQAHLRTLALAADRPAQFWIGAALFLWGAIVVVPFRVLAQHYQRHALAAQMAAVVIPAFDPAQRRRVLRKVLGALDGMPTRRAGGYMRAMLEGLDAAPAEARQLMARERVSVLAALQGRSRDHLMECMASGLAQLPEDQRARAMADTMSAVSELPSDERRAFIATTSAMAAP